MASEEPYTNRLIYEKSPYLLQHAHNPVDWYPWGNEAFEKAKKEDKPIFLSIGYSTCHWCHVMEEESFSHPGVAEIMNKYFVSIKVDREERPDLDNLYMQAVIAMTGTGGWPLNVFLTADLKPFYGGTYFPPEDKMGRPGFKTALNSIAASWKNNRAELVDSAQLLARAFQERVKLQAKESFPLDEGILMKKAYAELSAHFDAEYGGFKKAPKFPSGHILSFLLRYYKRAQAPKALGMVEKTLTEMARGGIFDHIAGGFHRYATDNQWRIPHFEKMLYDQALISRAYLEAFQVTKKQEYADIAKGIFEYVLGEMMQSQGGFYSAEDADSPLPENPKEKREGAFYLWSKDELLQILGKDYAEIISYYFGIEAKGKNILYIAHNINETASHFKKSAKDIETIIKYCKERLSNIRAMRPRPHLDDKILTDWNGLMLSSLSQGAMILNEPRYLSAARNCAEFILKNLQDKDGRVVHRYRDGQASIKGMLEDYAFFIQGLLDLYEAGFEPKYLYSAKQLTEEMLTYFWDKERGGFFFTAQDAEILFVRQKEIFDGAYPSGNSIAAQDLLRLGRLLMDKELEAKVESLFKAFSSEIVQAPSIHAQMLIALDFALGPTKEIVIAGEKESQDTLQMLRSIYQKFIPHKVVAFRPAEESDAKDIIRLIPFLEEQRAQEGKATAYVCENYVCKLPVTSIEVLNEILEK